jgi:hypothetical protein
MLRTRQTGKCSEFERNNHMSKALIVTEPSHPLLAELNAIQDVEKIGKYINRVLAAHESTKNVVLDWAPPSEKGTEPMTLNQLVKRSQDKRRVGMDANGTISKEGAKTRRTEFNSVRAVFILEGLNDLIEAGLRKLGYQPRFQGAGKDGKATMHYIAPHKQDDVVGKRATELAATLGASRMKKALIALYGEEKAERIAQGEVIEVESERIE